MARCPRCSCVLEIEYDREGFSCGAECTNCDWPSVYEDCPGCDEYMNDSKLDNEVLIDGETAFVCECCAETIKEEE